MGAYCPTTGPNRRTGVFPSNFAESLKNTILSANARITRAREDAINGFTAERKRIGSDKFGSQENTRLRTSIELPKRATTTCG